MRMGSITRSQKPSPMPTKMISDDACFNALLLGHVIDEKHKFEPVHVDACVVPRACDVAENAYRQAPEDVWVAAKSVMGTEQSPAWYSPSANELNEWIGGMFTLRALRMLQFAFAWLSQIRKNLQETSSLLSGDKLHVREKADQPWFCCVLQVVHNMLPWLPSDIRQLCRWQALV